MIYSIYQLLNGRILRVVECLEVSDQYDPTIEGYIEGSYQDTMFYVENGAPQQMPPSPGQWYVFNYDIKQWVQDPTLAEDSVNDKRIRLLYQSDWTQIPNNPLTPEQQQAWAIYRQELRDIPQQSGYPFNVIWPTPPST